MKYFYALLLIVILIPVGCTTDRDITEDVIIPDPEAVLVHYWNFNSLSSGTLDAVTPDYSLLPGTAKITYEGNGEGYMDSFNPGYTTNARNNDIDGDGLRARNPSDTRSLVLKMPTTGFKKVIVKFATARSGSGAAQQLYSYTLNGSDYITDGLTKTSFAAQQDPVNDLVTLDFSAISGADNNPNFAVKINFAGDTASGISGNNRFDNLTLEATPTSTGTAPSNLSYHTPNSFTINEAITALTPTITGNATAYSISPALPEGLSIDAATGAISGTPSIVSDATDYTVTASNANGSTTAVVSIAVAAPPAASVIHYWNFNTLPTGTLTTVPADMNASATGSATITYPGTGAGYMDQVDPGSALNAQNGDAAGLGIRFRNPSNTRSVIIKSPSGGYKNIVVKFATDRTSSGATEQHYSYSLDGTTFITTGLATTVYSPGIDPAYDVVTLDFSQITGANNNPNFTVKIDFGGTAASGTSGNDRFDNLTISGNSL